MSGAKGSGGKASGSQATSQGSGGGYTASAPIQSSYGFSLPTITYNKPQTLSTTPTSNWSAPSATQLQDMTSVGEYLFRPSVSSNLTSLSNRGRALMDAGYGNGASTWTRGNPISASVTTTQRTAVPGVPFVAWGESPRNKASGGRIGLETGGTPPDETKNIPWLSDVKGWVTGEKPEETVSGVPVERPSPEQPSLEQQLTELLSQKPQPWQPSAPQTLEPEVNLTPSEWSVADNAQRESGNQPVDNPLGGSASGTNQFIDATWLDVIKRNFPGLSKDVPDEVILSWRKSPPPLVPNLNYLAADAYRRENIEAAGVEDTGENANFFHRFGPGGGRTLLGADPSAVVGDVLGWGEEARRTNPDVAGGSVADALARYGVTGGRSIPEAVPLESATPMTPDGAQVRQMNSAPSYTRVKEDDWVDSPWLALGAGLASMLANRSVGKGGLQGLQFLLQQRAAMSERDRLAEEEARKREELDIRQQTADAQVRQIESQIENARGQLGLDREKLMLTREEGEADRALKRETLAAQGQGAGKIVPGVVGPNGGAIEALPDGRYRELEGVKPGKAGEKPSLPTTYQKAEEETLAAMPKIASNITQLRRVKSLLNSGELDLGAATNLGHEARNRLGYSSDQSREYALMRSTIEDLRNNILLLAKGVQTEGDAQRALNAITMSWNDAGVMSDAIDKYLALQDELLQASMARLQWRREEAGLAPIPMDRVVPGLSVTASEVDPKALGQKLIDIAGGSGAASPPKEAVDLLRQNPSEDVKRQFDQWYGPGAADAVLGAP